MIDTGIVRKIDDLGRIVIPIEIRRKLGVKVGDGMQIYIENSNVILSKYLPFDKFNILCNNIASLISNCTGMDTIITDTTSILVHPIFKESYAPNISAELFDILESYENVSLCSSDSIPLFENDKTKYMYQYIFPIIINSSIIGSIIVFSTDYRGMDSIGINTVKSIVDFFISQL